MRVGFTVRELIEMIEAEKVPDNAVVFVEYGDNIKAANAISMVETPEFPVLAIVARDVEDPAFKQDPDVN